MASDLHSRIRWDRVGRWALLAVGVLIVYLYIGPARRWVDTYAEARAKRAEVAELKARNAELREERRRLRQASSVEHQARALGMVRAGEKSFVVSGLPDG
jgi:cell division protein FtsB